MYGAFRLNERSFVLSFVFCCLPFFDMMTGFLVVRGIISEGSVASPSQIGRAVAGILLLYVAIKNRLGVLWLAIFFWIIFVEILAGIRSGQTFGAIFGLLTAYKLAYVWLSVTVLSFYAKRKIHDLGKFLKYNLVLISCSIL